MLLKTIDIRNNNSEEYAHLDIYALPKYEEMPNSRIHPMVIICPGGAYAWTSKREAEPIALKFLSEGISAAVLWYSTKPAVFPTALIELAASVKHIRENASEYAVDMNRVYIAGFSAGGHLAASYGCFWNHDFVKKAMGISENKAGWLKPNGMLLGYPVITSGPKAHHESINNLMGTDSKILKTDSVREIIAGIGLSAYDFESFCSALSLEKQVSDSTPKTFLWHTRTDESVPVENTLMFVNALQAHNIDYELHIYPEGGHGLSLGNDITVGKDLRGNVPVVQGWINEACRWIKM